MEKNEEYIRTIMEENYNNSYSDIDIVEYVETSLAAMPESNEKTFKITDVQLFDYKEHFQINNDGDFETKHGFSANIVINDAFVVQCGTNLKIDIPCSEDCFWCSETKQDYAAENFDIAKIIKQTGIESNREWLIENHTPEIMNREDAPNE